MPENLNTSVARSGVEDSLAEAEVSTIPSMVVPTLDGFKDIEDLNEVFFSRMKHYIASIDLNHTYYSVVCKPYNNTYDKYHDWYQVKAIDFIRKKIGCTISHLYTREILDCAKTHYNIVVCTSYDLMLMDDKKDNRFYYSVKKLDTYSDIKRWIRYICKEAYKRRFILYLDYIINGVKI